MKKSITLLLIIITLFATSINALAVTDLSSNTSTMEIKYFDDGSYIETVLIIEKSNISTYASGTNTGSKKVTYRNANDEIIWTATLTGTFSFTGTSATCTKSSITYSVSHDNWRITSASASKSGSKATGNVTAKYYFWGIPTKTVNEVITLTCSATGVLS